MHDFMVDFSVLKHGTLATGLLFIVYVRPHHEQKK